MSGTADRFWCCQLRWTDGQCGKLVTVVDHQFITLTVDICVQHGGRETLHLAGLSAAAETCRQRLRRQLSWQQPWHLWSAARAVLMHQHGPSSGQTAALTPVSLIDTSQHVVPGDTDLCAKKECMGSTTQLFVTLMYLLWWLSSMVAHGADSTKFFLVQSSLHFENWVLRPSPHPSMKQSVVWTLQSMCDDAVGYCVNA